MTDLDPDEDLALEKKSFRAYTSILYVDPVMQVYINKKKVTSDGVGSQFTEEAAIQGDEGLKPLAPPTALGR